MHRFLPAVIGALVLVAVLFGTAISKDAPKLPDLSTYKHINTLVVPDTESPIHGIHHFYMNETGLPVFKKGVNGGEYPADTIIVGKVFKPMKTEDGQYKEGDLAGYTMMEKAPGADTEQTGGWRFVMFDPTGKPKDVDPVTACFPCHKPSEETDYVLSTPLSG